MAQLSSLSVSGSSKFLSDIFIAGRITTDALTSTSISVTFLSSAWIASSDGTYYTQSASANVITEEDTPILTKALSYGASATEASSYNKAYRILCSGIGKTNQGSVTWQVYSKPERDITVNLVK